MSSKGRNKHLINRVDNVIYANFGQPQATAAGRGIEFHSGAANLLWCAAAGATDDGRVKRGLDYARKGHVMQWRAGNGLIVALVSGSQPEPFELRILLPYRSSDVTGQLSARIVASPQLAETGELLSVVVADSPEEIHFSCSCPDPVGVCKHAVAVAFTVAEALEAQPRRVFELRSINADELARDVQERAAEDSDRQARTRGPRFWEGTPTPPVPDLPVAPAIVEGDEVLLETALRHMSFTAHDGLAGFAQLRKLYTVLTQED
ncbi:MAG: hypothetical protein SPI77_08900 [Corynebacterium sp.]|nr:hypothetical protein [Corynebacterium sp.]